MIAKILLFVALLGCFAVGLAHKNKPSHVQPRVAPETKAYIYVGYNATMCKGFNGTFPVAGQCGAFYFCQNNYVYYDTCQGALNYNHMNGRCDYPYNVDCSRRGFNWNGFPYVQRQRKTEPRQARSVSAETKAYQFVGYNATMCKGFNGTLPVPGQCGAFYFCQNNYVYYDVCQGAFNYNHMNGRCDYPYNVDCTRRGFNWNGFPYVQRQRESEPRTRQVRSVSAETKAYEFVGYNATMCKGFNGTLPIRGQCGAFYFCQNNYVYRDVCQGALNYNHLNGRCDYPYNVDCSRRNFNWNGFPLVQNNKTKQLAAKKEQQTVKKESIEVLNNSEMPHMPCAHPTVMCFVDPCQFSKCGNVAGAQCYSDYCGGCNARWWSKSSGRFTEVTHLCRNLE